MYHVTFPGFSNYFEVLPFIKHFTLPSYKDKISTIKSTKQTEDLSFRHHFSILHKKNKKNQLGFIFNRLQSRFRNQNTFFLKTPQRKKKKSLSLSSKNTE